MTTTEPTDLLDQARERIAERRALLAAGTSPGEWYWHRQTGDIVTFAVENRFGPGPFDIGHEWNVMKSSEDWAPSDADAALIVAAVNAFAAAIDHAESVLERHAPMLVCPVHAKCDHGPHCGKCRGSDTWPCTDARAALVALGVLDG